MSETLPANPPRYKALRLSTGNVLEQKLPVLLPNENNYRLQSETQGQTEGVLSGARGASLRKENKMEV